MTAAAGALTTPPPRGTNAEPERERERDLRVQELRSAMRAAHATHAPRCVRAGARNPSLCVGRSFRFPQKASGELQGCNPPRGMRVRACPPPSHRRQGAGRARSLRVHCDGAFRRAAPLGVLRSRAASLAGGRCGTGARTTVWEGKSRGEMQTWYQQEA
eukprot:scaffold625_cov420-Prasinococcus_capsulatus_cf.AAC.15